VFTDTTHLIWEVLEFIAETRYVVCLEKKKKRFAFTSRGMIYQRLDKCVAFGVSTSRINRRMNKLLDTYGMTRKWDLKRDNGALLRFSAGRSICVSRGWPVANVN